MSAGKQIQWYPGHMTKAFRMMRENLSLIDVLVELMDARIPISSRNPDIDALCIGKERLIVLGKADLADPSANEAWMQHFRSLGARVLCEDVREKAGAARVRAQVQALSKGKRERDLKRGIKNRPVRVMVAGVPNSGKSTLINSLIGRPSARVGNHPGVTRGKQWVSLGKEWQLLDTPGLLWPKFEDPQVGYRLAAVGAINDDVLEAQEVAWELLRELSSSYEGALRARYCLEGPLPDGEGLLRAICEKKHMLSKGGEPDERRGAAFVLQEFRSGRMGRMSLERPPATEGRLVEKAAGDSRA